MPILNEKTQNVNDVVGEILPLKKDENSLPRWPEKVEPYITAINSKIEPEKLERMLDFYEWTLTQEGTDFMNYGLKDKDYTIDATGTVNKPDAKKVWEVYPSSIIGQIVSYTGSAPTKGQTSTYPVWIKERVTTTQQIKDKYAIPLNVNTNSILAKIDSKNLDMFDTSWYEHNLDNIISETDGKLINTGWSDFLNEVLNTKNGK